MIFALYNSHVLCSGLYGQVSHICLTDFAETIETTLDERDVKDCLQSLLHIVRPSPGKKARR